jgi:hypothetical protein
VVFVGGRFKVSKGYRSGGRVKGAVVDVFKMPAESFECLKIRSKPRVGMLFWFGNEWCMLV